MARKNTEFLDYGIEEEVDPKIKFNSLLSVTVSTVMCLAAKCPLPKSNVETTKLFLSAITDDNGEGPRNMKKFLTLLNDYQGPYDSGKEKCLEKPREKPTTERPSKDATKDQEPSQEYTTGSKSSRSGSSSLGKEMVPVSQLPQATDALIKRIPRPAMKRQDRELVKKTNKTLGSRISSSKSLVSNKS